MAETYCDECGYLLAPGPDADAPRVPCPACGGTRRSYHLYCSDQLTFHEYIGVKHAPAKRDRSLPEGGVTRSYQGVRQGRDGRMVDRTALYDPYRDLAEERAVDTETGDVIVDKSESMRAKYIREGRWRPDSRGK